MKNYKHLFFDLDKTLWDFTENSKDTFKDLFKIFNLYDKGIPAAETFHNKYNIHNERLWDLYRQGLVEKDYLSNQRFILALNDFSINDNLLAKSMAKEYIRISPLKTKLLPDAHSLLKYLSGKYFLHIITNGFNEVQFIKIESCGLRPYFKEIITSEEAGCNKPNREIFLYALCRASALPTESMMIGDDPEADVSGAVQAGIDQIYVNYGNIASDIIPTYEVNCLKEIMKIL